MSERPSPLLDLPSVEQLRQQMQGPNSGGQLPPSNEVIAERYGRPFSPGDIAGFGLAGLAGVRVEQPPRQDFGDSKVQYEAVAARVAPVVREKIPSAAQTHTGTRPRSESDTAPQTEIVEDALAQLRSQFEIKVPTTKSEMEAMKGQVVRAQLGLGETTHTKLAREGFNYRSAVQSAVLVREDHVRQMYERELFGRQQLDEEDGEDNNHLKKRRKRVKVKK